MEHLMGQSLIEKVGQKFEEKFNVFPMFIKFPFHSKNNLDWTERETQTQTKTHIWWKIIKSMY